MRWKKKRDSKELKGGSGDKEKDTTRKIYNCSLRTMQAQFFSYSSVFRRKCEQRQEGSEMKNNKNELHLWSEMEKSQERKKKVKKRISPKWKGTLIINEPNTKHTILQSLMRSRNETHHAELKHGGKPTGIRSHRCDSRGEWEVFRESHYPAEQRKNERTNNNVVEDGESGIEAGSDRWKLCVWPEKEKLKRKKELNKAD